MSSEQTNPILQQDDPFADYRDSMSKNLQDRQSKEAMEIQRLCYALFIINPDGAMLLNLLREQFMHRSIYGPNTTNPEATAMYWEGFRDAFRSLGNLANTHAMMAAHPSFNKKEEVAA